MDAKLNESTVIVAAQRPALVLLVPMYVFVAECLLLLVLGGVLGFWALILMPAHVLLITLTDADFQWPRKLWCTLKMHTLVSNNGIRKRGIVTFIANPILRKD